ncbi:hypothetical protein FACS1894130_11360 [Spirochaetia bacterium]|nr:hypothetical protein FACS1894130_11360 [Spirochaetia bacterium]
MKKLLTFIFLSVSLNVYSQSIFNGYWNIYPLNLGMWMDDGEFNGVLSADLNLFSKEYWGDLGLGVELRTYMPDDSLNYEESGRIVELGGRLVYGYYFGTGTFGIYPYGGLTLGYLFGNGGINTTAILGARLNIWKGWGLYSEYVFSLADRKSYITAGISLMGILKRNPPSPRPTPVPAPKPKIHPTITKEELRRVELAYAETIRDIENRGKTLRINNSSERSTFIQRYQGSPNTRLVNETRNTKLPYYSVSTTSERDIVALARQEPNDFMKVRMIHDWVSDVFAYDFDYLSWMRNISGRNKELTLGQMVQIQRGVCLEYAILFWFLMDSVGIDTYLTIDNSNPDPNIGHAYNMVVINGTGYIIDTTWDSGNWFVNSRITKFDRMISKDYFMPGVSQSYRLRRW